ncbi:MAG: phosphate ABC transporter permease PstA [Bacteroidota bacterium]|nr:phosphate ABC transporter permease PstA [Bacteroidota bacterium]
MKRKQLNQKIIFTTFAAISIMMVSLVTLILLFIIINGFTKISWDFISKYPEEGMMKGGIYPAIIGTLMLIGGSCAIAFPAGILSGIYVNEYAEDNWFKKLVGMMTNNLAGVPSIVFGLFGLALFVNWMHFGVSLLSGCLTLAVLILPVIIRTTEESLKTIDNTYRLASYAIGASKFTTIFRVVLPMAIPNIITGLIICVGRVAGETAPIIFTVVAYYLPEVIISMNSPVMALPYHLYVMSTSGIDLNASRDIAFGTALVLLMIILTLNLIAGVIRKLTASKHKS